MSQFIDITKKSGLNNIGNSFKGIVFGIVLIIASIILLWYNEGKAVHVAQALEEGTESVKHIDANKIDDANENKLVHLSDKLTIKDSIHDVEFNVRVLALKLSKNVEYFQWEEEATNKTVQEIGGGSKTTTSYSYVKKWVNQPIKSENFENPEHHKNTVPIVIKEKSVICPDIKLGLFSLSEEVTTKINGYEELPINCLDTLKYKNAIVNGGKIYLGSKNILNPEIGDVRVSFSVLYPKTISVIAKQTNNTLEEYTTSNGESVLLIKDGIVSSEKMFKTAVEGNKFRTWLFRLIGFLLMFFGFKGILRPIVTIGNIIPFIGKIADTGTSLISLALAIPLSLVIIAIAWLAYRPLLTLLLIVLGIIIYIAFRRKNSIQSSNKETMTNTNKVINETKALNGPNATPIESNSLPRNDVISTSGQKVIHIVLSDLQSSLANNFTPNALEVALIQKGVSLKVIQEFFEDQSHHITPRKVEIDAHVSFSKDAIDYMKKDIVHFVEYKTVKHYDGNANDLPNKIICEMTFYYHTLFTKK